MLYMILAIALLYPARVSQETAAAVAEGWWQFINSGEPGKIKEISSVTHGDEPLYYIINMDGTGFIIIAGNDASVPILAYGKDSPFPKNIESPEVAYWMNLYAEQLMHIIATTVNTVYSEQPDTIHKFYRVRAISNE